jgi:hypothetical protein
MNARYVRYARVHGNTPERQLEADQERFHVWLHLMDGGRMEDLFGSLQLLRLLPSHVTLGVHGVPQAFQRIFERVRSKVPVALPP